MTERSEPPTDNQAYFGWPDPEGLAREVWYSLVSHPTEPIAFWYRYTLVSTADGGEARVWAALTDGRDVPPSESSSAFVTEQYELDRVTLDNSPFSLQIGEEAVLRSDSAAGRVGADSERITWSFEYEPDELTFTPIRDEQLMREAADQMGTGCHWSPNQSVFMEGTVTVGDTTWAFTDAPGHQGHTAGQDSPSELSWVHCNAFDDDVSFEALSIDDRLVPVCLRLPEESHLINRQADVFGETVEATSEPGSFELRGETDAVTFDARVDADGPWQRASYLLPDGSLRYNAHCSLATVELMVETADETRTYHSEHGRAEWVATTPPLPGQYPPFETDDA